MAIDLKNWPRDPDSPGRYLCNSDHPKPPNAPGPWTHEEAEYIDCTPDGMADMFKCPVCGAKWTHYFRND